jgi:precorrin-6A/cobalt-precorrin-6A reductase
MRRHRVDVLVTKNSGGGATAPKLDAARSLRLPVVMVRRPLLPEGVPVLDSVEAVLDRVARRTRRQPG